MRQAWIWTHLTNCYRLVSIWCWWFSVIKMPLVSIACILLFTFSKGPQSTVCFGMQWKKKKKSKMTPKKTGSVEKSDIRKSNGNMHLHKYKLCSCLLILGSMKCLKKNVFEEPPLMPISLGQNWLYSYLLIQRQITENKFSYTKLDGSSASEAVPDHSAFD